MSEGGEALCWRCARAGGGCPWSARLEPVPGWTARQVEGTQHNGDTYKVEACPLFQPDPPRRAWRPPVRIPAQKEERG